MIDSILRDKNWKRGLLLGSIKSSIVADFLGGRRPSVPELQRSLQRTGLISFVGIIDFLEGLMCRGYVTPSEQSGQ